MALAEFKGPQLQQYDKDKAGAVHMHYGRAFMVGVGAKDKKELRLLRLADGSLVDDGLFEVGRLCYELRCKRGTRTMLQNRSLVSRRVTATLARSQNMLRLYGVCRMTRLTRRSGETLYSSLSYSRARRGRGGE